ncbi:MAG: alpha/beta hydrolase [Alphaproteobacteria bacterium]
MGWLAAALVGYGAVVAGAFVFQRGLLYFPSTVTPDPAVQVAGRMAAAHYRTVDGLDLTGWYRAAEDRRPTLVYFHGNAGHHGDRATLVGAYLDAGYGVLLAGYRGYGGNPGRPTEQGLYRDGRAALAWLAEHGVPAGDIVLYGESLGSGVAVQMAIEAEVRGVVLQAPFTSAVDVGQAAYRILPVRWLMWDRFDSLAKVGALDAPLLLIHGEADRVIPVRFGRRLYAAAPEPKEARFIAGGDHNDLHLFGITATVLDFLARLPG